MTSANLLQHCEICCSTESILNCDAIHNVEDVSAHYFCLLFSSGLGQRGEEGEGLKGFLVSDIKREVRRGGRLKCVYCRKKGATVGCAEQKCKKSYHPICGQKHNSLFQFYDQFKSFCKEHRPSQNVKKGEGGKSGGPCSTCTICQEKLVRKATIKILWSPCCHSFFHRECVQSLAISAGKEHFKCPNCNDKEVFLQEMRETGVYVPEQDASWEKEGLFEDIDRDPPLICHAKLCFCPKEQGRSYHSEGGVWEVILCDTCGSKGIHARCGGMEDVSEALWHCYTCRDGLRGRGEEDTFLRQTNKLLEKRNEVFESSQLYQSSPVSSYVTSLQPSPNPMLSALLASLPPVEEKTYTTLVVPVVKQKNQLSHESKTYTVKSTGSENNKTILTKINSNTSFTDLIGSMLDNGDGSPGDSDYESSQDNVGLGSAKSSCSPSECYRKKLQIKRYNSVKSDAAPGNQSKMTDFFSSQKIF